MTQRPARSRATSATPTLNRAQRRRLSAAAEATDRIVKADEAFYERFPDRRHRVRLASQAEMDANAAANGLAEVATPAGQRWFCIVRQIAPGVRSRVFVQNDADVETDMDEVHARLVYEVNTPPSSLGHTIERQIVAALASGRLR